MVKYSGIIRCVGAHFLLLSEYTSSQFSAQIFLKIKKILES